MFKGIILLLLAEISFTFSTVFAKLITNVSQVSSFEITFFRFLIGFIVVDVYCWMTKKRVKPRHKKNITFRAIGNTLSVILFFMGIQYTTITNANMLNMTYPVFVFLFSPLINHERIIPIRYYFYLVLAMLGIYFVIYPDFNHINIGDIFGLLSGITAGFSVSFLREANKFDTPYTILYYVFGFGLIINFFLILHNFILPKGLILFYIVLSALLAVAGQFFITNGYRYIDAHRGSLVSTSRIIFAALLGIIIFSESLTFRIILGGCLIFIALIGISGSWVWTKIMAHQNRVENNGKK